MKNPTRATHFATASDLRAWLAKNHGKAGELSIGFYKRSAKKQGTIDGEALDEALCFGWIEPRGRRAEL